MKEIIIAIGIETTGLPPKRHDIVELEVVPQDGGWKTRPSRRQFFDQKTMRLMVGLKART